MEWLLVISLPSPLMEERHDQDMEINLHLLG